MGLQRWKPPAWSENDEPPSPPSPPAPSPLNTRSAILVFPNVQQLDLTGPYEVFASWPGARVRFVAKTFHPGTSSTGLKLIPDVTFDDCPQLDLCVPDGAGASRGGESDIHPRDQQ
jgi:hypothetical protein